MSTRKKKHVIELGDGCQWCPEAKSLHRGRWMDAAHLFSIYQAAISW